MLLLPGRESPKAQESGSGDLDGSLDHVVAVVMEKKQV